MCVGGREGRNVLAVSRMSACSCLRVRCAACTCVIDREFLPGVYIRDDFRFFVSAC